MIDNNVIADKIAALLRKAERTDHEHEADAYLAKAEELMIRYGIEQAELQGREGYTAEKIIRVELPLKGVFKKPLTSLLHGVTTQFETVKSYKLTGYKHEYYVIVGYEAEVRQLETLLVSLQLQSMTAMTRWWKTHPLRGGGPSTAAAAYADKREFIYGFSSGVTSKLQATKRAVDETVSTGSKELVSMRGTAVQAWLDENVGRLGKGRASSSRRGSAFANQSGNAAGRSANINQTGVGGSRGAIRG